MKYYDTETEVRLGDRVIYKHLFWGQSEGEVAYLPGVSAVHAKIIPNQWVVRLGNGKGVFMVFGPDIEFTHKRIKFLKRSAPSNPIEPNEEI
jgi:hypothetical protein